jgi:hypothetical protein
VTPDDPEAIDWHWSTVLLGGPVPEPSGQVAASADVAPVVPGQGGFRRLGHGVAWRTRRVRNRVRWIRRAVARRGLTWLHDVRTARADPTRSILREWVSALSSRRTVRTVADELRVAGRFAIDPASGIVRSSFGVFDRAGASGATVVRLSSTVLRPASVRPASFWLATSSGDVWLGAHEPHVHPPVATTRRRLGPVTGFDDVVGRLPTRRRARASALRAATRLGVIDCSSTAVSGPDAARAALDLIGVGALLGAQRVPGDVAVLLGPDLSAAIEAVPVDRPLTDAERERWSVAQRRIVYRRHSVYRALAEVGHACGNPVPPDPSVSVLMATNRPDMVTFAVEQMVDQGHPDIEILIGLHCVEAPEYVRGKIRELVPDATVFDFGADTDLGQVLDSLARRASGTLVTKWDDDDWYAPHHVSDLVDAMRYSGATLVGKAAEYIHLGALDITIRRFATGSERFSTTIAGGTLMTSRRTLSEIGGWPSGPKRVDRLLIDRITETGGSVYRLHGDGYLLRRSPDPTSHTWQAGDSYFLGQAVDQRPGLDLDFAGIVPVSASGESDLRR